MQNLRHAVRFDSENAHYKFIAFDKLFHDSKTQESLNAYFDSFTWRFIKNICHLLTGGLVAKFITKGTFRFWKTTEELFIERMNNHSQKNADFKSRMHADVESVSTPPSISIVTDKPANDESISSAPSFLISSL